MSSISSSLSGIASAETTIAASNNSRKKNRKKERSDAQLISGPPNRQESAVVALPEKTCVHATWTAAHKAMDDIWRNAKKEKLALETDLQAVADERDQLERELDQNMPLDIPAFFRSDKGRHDMYMMIKNRCALLPNTWISHGLYQKSLNYFDQLLADLDQVNGPSRLPSGTTPKEKLKALRQEKAFTKDKATFTKEIQYSRGRIYHNLKNHERFIHTWSGSDIHMTKWREEALFEKLGELFKEKNFGSKKLSALSEQVIGHYEACIDASLCLPHNEVLAENQTPWKIRSDISPQIEDERSSQMQGLIDSLSSRRDEFLLWRKELREDFSSTRSPDHNAEKKPDFTALYLETRQATYYVNHLADLFEKILQADSDDQLIRNKRTGYLNSATILQIDTLDAHNFKLFNDIEQADYPSEITQKFTRLRTKTNQVLQEWSARNQQTLHSQDLQAIIPTDPEGAATPENLSYGIVNAFINELENIGNQVGRLRSQCEKLAPMRPDQSQSREINEARNGIIGTLQVHADLIEKLKAHIDARLDGMQEAEGNSWSPSANERTAWLDDANFDEKTNDDDTDDVDDNAEFAIDERDESQEPDTDLKPQAGLAKEPRANAAKKPDVHLRQEESENATAAAISCKGNSAKKLAQWQKDAANAKTNAQKEKNDCFNLFDQLSESKAVPSNTRRNHADLARFYMEQAAKDFEKIEKTQRRIEHLFQTAFAAMTKNPDATWAQKQPLQQEAKEAGRAADTAKKEAEKARKEGKEMFIALTKKSPPTKARLLFLIEENEIQKVTRSVEEIPVRDSKGVQIQHQGQPPKTEPITEYQIYFKDGSNPNIPDIFAHIHYVGDTSSRITARHLKAAVDRLRGANYQERSGETVHRGKIDQSVLKKLDRYVDQDSGVSRQK